MARALDTSPRYEHGPGAARSLGLLVVRFRAHLSAKRVERQMEIARQVQRALLPLGHRLAARFRSSRLSGGPPPMSAAISTMPSTFPAKLEKKPVQPSFSAMCRARMCLRRCWPA